MVLELLLTFLLFGISAEDPKKKGGRLSDLFKPKTESVTLSDKSSEGGLTQMGRTRSVQIGSLLEESLSFFVKLKGTL